MSPSDHHARRRRDLEAMPHRDLVERVLAWADQHEDIRSELDLAAAASRRAVGQLDVSQLRRTVDSTTRTYGFVPTRASWDYARRLQGLAAELAALVGAGYGGSVVELAERAVLRVDKALTQSVDDSNGVVGEAMRRLRDVHLMACLAARPEPAAFGRHLYRLHMDSEYAFEEVLPSYAEVMGEEGLAAYRAAAEKDWQAVPAVGPGQERDWGKHIRLRLAMEALAKQSRDLEELVGVLSRDLSSPYSYLRIAEELAGAGEHDRALEWAEKGHRAFSQRREYDARLVGFLVAEYHRRGRDDDALELRWDAFERQPWFAAFQDLKASAEAARKWPALRERALAHLRATLRPAKDKASWMHPGFGTLVEIYLSEDDVESAWSAATQGGCQPQIWLKLARRLEADQPERAIEIYRRHIDLVVAATNNQAYAEAIDLLRTIRQLLDRSGRADQFPGVVSEIREAHRLKRNLMKLLDAQRW